MINQNNELDIIMHCYQETGSSPLWHRAEAPLMQILHPDG